MEDIIDIIVTETTNLIEITSQPTDEIIDVNIIDNREDVTLNVTPTVVEININSLTGNFGINWGEITGTLSNQTDLNTALGLKADLVGGKVPSSQLPSYVDDVVEVANYAALPATGETGKIYVTIDTNYIYRWTGSVYVEIKDSSAVWGAITGTLSNQTDLQSALNAKANDNAVVHNTGNESVAGLKTFTSGISADYLWIKEGTGLANPSGYAQLATDLTYFHFNNSNNTAFARFLYGSGQRTYTLPDSNGTIALTSDLHNAVTIGTANGLSLSTQVLSLGLASSSANGALSSTDWSTFNGKQNALSGTGFVKISGSTISYDNSTYLTTSSAASTYLPLSGGTLTGALSGTSISLSSSITASALYVSGMTAGSGAIYHTASRLTFANYNANGTLHFEVNGGTGALTINADTSASFVSTLSATGATLSGNLGGTSASFSSTITNTLAGNSARGLYFTANQPSGINWYDTDDVEQYSVGIIANSGSGYWGVWSSTSSTAIDRAVAIPKFKIANSGAATFSSSVTASGSKSQFVADGGASSGAGISLNTSLSGTDRRNWFIGTEENVAGDFVIKSSNAAGGNANSGTTRIQINNNGNVGIGTTSPFGKLSVDVTSAAPSSSGNMANGLTVHNTSFGRALQFGVNDSGAYNYIQSSYVNNADVGVNLAFFTGASERMRLTSDGILQFSTTSVVPTTNNAIYSYASNGYMYIQGGSTGVALAGSGDRNNAVYVNTSINSILFHTNGAGERMRLTSGGNVLIGTTTDDGSKLRVNGRLKIDGGVTNITNNSQTTIYSSIPVYSDIIFSVKIWWDSNANAQQSYLIYAGAVDTGWGTPNSGITTIQSINWAQGYAGGTPTFAITGTGTSRNLAVTMSNASTYNVNVRVSIISLN